MNHAIDVPTLLTTLFAGRGVRAAGALPPGVTGYDSTRAPYQYDPAEARRLLKEAGHPNGFAVQLWRTQRAELARLAQSIQQSLAAVGVRAEIVERDASSARAAVRKGEADLFLTDWWADYPDPENFLFLLECQNGRTKSGGPNTANFCNAEYDRLYREMKDLPNTERRLGLIGRMLVRGTEQTTAPAQPSLPGVVVAGRFARDAGHFAVRNAGAAR